MNNIINIKNSKSINTTGSSLIGYVTGTYEELIKAFGEPTYKEPSGDGKVSTEWKLEFELDVLEFELADKRKPYVKGTIYDWKRYDGGDECRSGDKFVWHVGGMDYAALELIQEKLEEVQNDAVGAFVPLKEVRVMGTVI